MIGVLHRLRDALSKRLHPPYRISGVCNPVTPYYHYREGDHKVSIYAESTRGDARGNMLIDGWTLVRWDAPHDDELIAEEKQHLILERLQEHERSYGVRFWIHYEPKYVEREHQAALQKQREKDQGQ